MNIGLAVGLLVLIISTHYTPDPISSIFPEISNKALFYVMRGIEGAFLFGLIIWLRLGLLVSLVCLWGMIEELETAICRLSKPLGSVPVIPLFVGLCGSPFYTAGLMAMTALTIFIWRK